MTNRTPSDSELIQQMSKQIATMYGTMYGEGNTEGTVSAVRRIDKSLAVHIDGERAEARRTAAIISTIVSISGVILTALGALLGFPVPRL